MTQYLMVPIRLDAMYVASGGQSVATQNADFTKLPFFDRVSKSEVSSETPNISEYIVNQPFQSEGLFLSPGVHLHWALPDALTRGNQTLDFPNVPDRWLITRRRKGEAGEQGQQWKIDKQWVVESNYLYPPYVDKSGVSINVPFHSDNWIKDSAGQYKYKPVTTEQDIKNRRDNAKRASQPFRYMGRSMSASAWQKYFADAEYYPKLTAIGYGEPTFAAFYPNCFSVFGFCDANPGDKLSDIRYEVAGWYSDINDNKDLLSQEFEQQLKQLKDDKSAELTSEEREKLKLLTKANIEKKYNWTLAKTEEGEQTKETKKAPERLLCYAGLSFSKDTLSDHLNKNSDVSITVGETITEALSACLANKMGDSMDQQQQKLIEDQLEAMQMAFRLNEKKLDTVACFKQMRHQNGFADIDCGFVWRIGKSIVQNTQEKDRQQVMLPPAFANDLTAINNLQRQYDRQRHKIASLRKQLFADWYKYMICLYPPGFSEPGDYPDVDLVKYFIESRQLKPLQDLLTRTGELAGVKKGGNDDRVTAVEKTDDSDADSLASQLVESINQLIKKIDAENRKINEKSGIDVRFFLRQTPATRYKRANDPVVLIEGKAVESSQRHGADGKLTCQLLTLSDGITGKEAFATISAKIAELEESQRIDRFAFNTQSSQPWSPFLLQWEVQVLPLQQANSQLPTGYFSASMITDHYHAPALEPDLQLKSNKSKISRSSEVNSYSGESILTPQANHLLKHAIEKRLIDDLKIFTSKEDIAEQKLSEKKEQRLFVNPTYTLTKAYERLRKLSSLSQSLNGFNESLLMYKPTMELAVEDPIGFTEYQKFSSDHDAINNLQPSINSVGGAMGDNIRIAPSPHNRFNPIRNGYLKISRMRLVDTFGQVLSLSTDKIDTTYKLTEPNSPHLIKLPPRLAQPARLNFRWLNANDTSDEVQSHPDSMPICGWLLTNKLDQSLVVYHANGQALGYFKAGCWRQAIDSDYAKEIAAIENSHLKRVVEFIDDTIQTDKDKNNGQQTFLNNFIGTIDDALDNIHIEGGSGLQTPVLLISRPVAVVRASLNLEVQGYPAIDQSWDAFRQDIAKNTRSTNNFTKVKFPIRLGEYGQFNDGLVGYWMEQTDNNGAITFAPDSGDNKVKFYSPQSDYIDTDAIESRYEYESGVDGPINLYQTLDDLPRRVTLLMDVRGCVHASAGILPSKAIDIPRDLYEEALQNIEVTFLHAPLLTAKNKIELPLRRVRDYTWSWVGRASNSDGDKEWHEWFPENRIDKAVFIKEWEQQTQKNTGAELWDYLLNKVKWLAPVDDNEDGRHDSGRAKIVEPGDREVSKFDEGEPFAGAETITEAVLDLYSTGIDPATADATFSSVSEIKEGWLKLRRIDRKKSLRTNKTT